MILSKHWRDLVSTPKDCQSVLAALDRTKSITNGWTSEGDWRVTGWDKARYSGHVRRKFFIDCFNKHW